MTLTNKERKCTLIDHLQSLAFNTCYLFHNRRCKACTCFNVLQNGICHQETVAKDLLGWTTLDKEKHDCAIIPEIHILVELEEELKKHKIKSKSGKK